MTIMRILLNVVGFFVLLDGCIGVTSPSTSKMLMNALIEKLNITIIRALSFLWGILCGAIAVGTVVSGPQNKLITDYLLTLGTGAFAAVYIIMAFTLPNDLRESDFLRNILEMPDNKFRLYESATLAMGIFIIFISVRY